jgi:hypothetical protein
VNNPDRRRFENELLPHLEKPAKVSSFMLGEDALKEAFQRFIHDTEVASTSE